MTGCSRRRTLFCLLCSAPKAWKRMRRRYSSSRRPEARRWTKRILVLNPPRTPRRSFPPFGNAQRCRPSSVAPWLRTSRTARGLPPARSFASGRSSAAPTRVSPGEISGWAARVVRAGAGRGPAGAADRLPPAGEPEDARLGVAEDFLARPSGPKPGDPAGAAEASVSSWPSHARCCNESKYHRLPLYQRWS
jgi:hypothetical protein